MAQPSLQQLREQVLHKPFRPAGQSPILGVSQSHPDPKNPTMTITSQTQVPFRDLFKNAPTPDLYILRDLVDEILASRTDAKR